MGLISKQFKTAEDSGRIEPELTRNSTNGSKSTRIPKNVDRSPNKISKKTVKRCVIGGVKKTQHKNTLQTALKILQSHNVTPLESKILSFVPKHKHNLKLEQVEVCVSAMLEFKSRNSKSKDHLLFDDVAQPIHMTVQCMKVPTMNSKNYRFCLPNPLVDESSEVCLFVPNLKKGRSEDHEPTIEHYRDILEKHEVKGITQIIPLRQINVEYDQFELKRHLVNQFDMFLADGRITGHVQGLLGKEIHKRRKLPVPVDLRVKDLKKEVDKALSKTLLMMNGHGNKASLKIGHTKQPVPQIAENIIAVAEGLAQRFPGGWANIRSLKIHLQDSVPIPVYICLDNSNKVEVPVVNPVYPKKAIPLHGEISTVPGVRVTVLPGGGVIVKKKTLTKEEKEMGLSDSDLEDLDLEEQMETDASDEETTSKDPLPNTEKQEDDDDTDSDVSSVGGDEHVAEAAENVYLSQWREQWNEIIKAESRKRKEKPVEDAKHTSKKNIRNRKTAKNVKGKEIENKNSENSDKVDDVEDTPQIKKPKVIQDKTKRKIAKNVKGKEIENENSKKVDDVEDTPQIKKPKVIQDKTKRKIAKNVKGKEIENENSKKVLQSIKVSTTSTDVTSPLIISSKKLKMKRQKTSVNVKNIAKEQRFNKNLVSQKKKKRTGA